MESDLPTDRDFSREKELAELRAVLKERETELAERKRFDEELYSLVHTLEKRLTETSVQLAASRQELRLERQMRTESEQEITTLTGILVRQQDAYEIVNRELDSFNYAISHDLRAPLRHLLGFATALVEDYGDTLDRSAHIYLDSISRAAQKMESQIQALLKLSRIGRQELRFAKVDLGALARECAAGLMQAAPDRNVVFSFPDQLVVEADADLMKTALDHLLQNAWKYTRNRETGSIELGRKQEGAAIIYFVRDNGAGFDMRYADRLFGPFQRMHSEHDFEGMGMGLATVQRILHRHGGRIWAQAEVNVGATFFFTLHS